jgi:hypothetical protein
MIRIEYNSLDLYAGVVTGHRDATRMSLENRVIINASCSKFKRLVADSASLQGTGSRIVPDEIGMNQDSISVMLH